MWNPKIDKLFTEIKMKISCSYVTPRNLKKLFILNYVVLLLTILVAAITPTANGYEFSIYSAYPGYFWFLIILSITLGQLNAILSVLGNATKKYWVLGFLAILIADSLLLFLPMIRGYFIYGSGDILTHIGYMIDIDNSGLIGSNFYPMLHILGCSICYTAGLSYDIITISIPAIFSIFSVLCWYIFGREIFYNKFGIVILMEIAALPIYGVVNSLFTPNGEAFLMLPLIFYVIIKSQKTVCKKEIILIVILLSVLIVFFHPLITIMLMSIYALLYISNYLLRSLYPSKYVSGHILVIVFIIMAIIFSIWCNYLYLLKNALDPLISSTIGTEIVQSEVTNNLDLLSRVNMDILDLIKLGLLTYGINAILGLLSLLCILYLLVLYLRKQIMISSSLFSYIVCFLFFFILGVTIFFTVFDFGYNRVYKIALLFSIVIIPSTIIAMYRKLSVSDKFHKYVFSVFVWVLIVILTYLSIFSLHMSPLMKLSNQQVAMGNYYGMATFFETRDDSIGILEYGISQTRYFEAIYGTSNPKVNIRFDWGASTTNLRPIDHFGYTTSSYFGSHYEGKQYFLLTEDGREFYENTYPEFPDAWRFTDQDFKRLESDASTIRIYSNEHLDIYMLNY